MDEGAKVLNEESFEDIALPMLTEPIDEVSSLLKQGVEDKPVQLQLADTLNLTLQEPQASAMNREVED